MIRRVTTGRWAIERIMVTDHEGGDWFILPIHSIVLDGKRWDAVTREWRPYLGLTAVDLEANRRELIEGRQGSIKRCEACGTRFYAATSRRRFCCDYCRVKAWRRNDEAAE